MEPDLPEPTWACSWCAWCGNRISLPPDGCVFHAGECPVRWLQTTTPAALVAARAGVLLDDRGWVLLRRVLGSSYLEFGHVDGLWCAEMLRKGAGLDG